MKILHLIKTSKGAVWAYNFTKDLKERHPDLKIYVVVPKGGKLYTSYEEFCEEVYDFEFTLGVSAIRRGNRLKAIVKSVDPDMIHSWFTQTTLYARLFLKGINCPRLYQVVGPLHLENKLYKLADIISASKNDYWIATSEYIYNKYKNAGITEDRLFLNYAYIDARELYNKNVDVRPIDYHLRHNLPSGSRIIGTASYIYSPKRFEKYGVKGHEFLILAFADLLKKREDVYLVIAGEPFLEDQSYLNKLKEMAAKYCGDRVLFTGRYENVYEVIGNMDVFVYLSRSENLGGVYESLLFEIPTVSSKAGGLPELVEDGVTGFTVEPEDSSEIANRIDYILKNPDAINEFKAKGSKQVYRIFDKNLILSKGFEIYNKIRAQNK